MATTREGRTAAPLDPSPLRLLRTEAEYDAAVAEIAALMDQESAPGTPAADRLDVLTLLVAAYDDAHYPMGDTVTPRTSWTSCLNRTK